jgi:hypothetical protein
MSAPDPLIKNTPEEYPALPICLTLPIFLVSNGLGKALLSWE